MESTLRLFKAVPVEKKRKGKVTKKLLKATIKSGYVFSPEVVAECTEGQLSTLMGTIQDLLGLSPEQMNASFHKSWGKVATAPIQQLVIEQIVHYISTYAYISAGIYSDDTIYIPAEELDIPEIKKGKIPLTVIKGYTKEELKEKLLKLLETGIAMSEQTIDDVFEVLVYVGVTGRDMGRVNNKEVKSILLHYLGLVPEDPTEFLRYLVYEITDKTLLIKNKDLIETLKTNGKNISNLGLINKYEELYGLERLSSIFYRFKPIFLALKGKPAWNKKINKIRKLATKNHKPMPEDYLNNLTGMIARKKLIKTSKLESELEKVNIFRKIRLAYSLNYRASHPGSIIYKIRNGRSFAKEYSGQRSDQYQKSLKHVLKSIVSDLSHVEGMKIYIPKCIDYALPATEKQFTGQLPSGTSVFVPKDAIFGIHWTNLDHTVIDLDLSLQSLNGTKIGWDGVYRTEHVLFSGDVTSAPKPRGASELFYLKKNNPGTYMLFVNYYNYNPNTEVPFKILVANRKMKSLSENYMVDPNRILCTAQTSIKVKQQLLGLVQVTDAGCTFTFCQTSIGKSITSMNKDWSQHAINYLNSFYSNPISFRDILIAAGAELVEEKDQADLDLSPEALEKDSIISLISP